METLKNVISSLRELSALDDGDPVFSGHKTHRLSDGNFHEIAPKNGRIAFVDGGNAEILSASNFSLSFVRVYASVFDGKRKVSAKRKEFYVLTTAKFDKDVAYKTQIFSDWIKMPDFSGSDPTLRDGMFPPDASKISGIVRRFSEWKMASEISGADVIIMDGTLHAAVTGETKFAEAAFRNALDTGITMTSLAKTSALMTTTGNDLISVLKRRGPDKWMYHPVADIESDSHKAEVCVIKLHEHSRHAFRFEILKEQKHRLADAVSIIAGNSNDYRFPGYPYGLVDADRFARISERDRMYLRSLFAAANIDESSSNAHDILNKIFR